LIILKKYLDKIVKEKNYLEKKSAEQDQNFHDKCNHLWELCRNCYDKFGAKPEDPAGSLVNLIYSLLGCAANMMICQLLFRLVLI